MLGSAGSNVGVATGGTIAAFAPFAGPGAPVVAAVGAVVALASTIAGAIHIGEGCGPTCIEATSIVNKAEVVLKQNLAAFQAGQLDTATALDNFNRVWQAVEQSCAAVPGDAGKNCVGDRQRGGKWDWFVYYYDPIANAPIIASTYNNPTTDAGSMVNSIIDYPVFGYPLWMVVGVVGLLSLVTRKQNYAS
jgi:hypothetical protein